MSLEAFESLEAYVTDVARARQDAGAQILIRAGDALLARDDTLADIMRGSFDRSQVRVDRARNLLVVLGRHQEAIESAFDDCEVPVPEQITVEKVDVNSSSSSVYAKMREAAERKIQGEVAAVSRIAKALGKPNAFIKQEGEQNERFIFPLPEALPSLGATIINILIRTANIRNVGELISKTKPELLAVSGISRPRFVNMLFALYDEGYVPLEQPIIP